jgi:putative ABC transport system substrate-binding protein
MLEDPSMRRSVMRLIAVLALGLCLAPSPSHAQVVAKMPRIGMLTFGFDPHSGFEAFRQGLRDLGYVEGQSIALEYRFAGGKVERLPELAAALVSLQVDIVFTVGTAAVQAAQHATATIPIVFMGVDDPVGQGLVASLARPGGHTTGLVFQDPALMGKRLELLKEAVPGVTRVAYLWHGSGPGNRFLRERYWRETERAARALGIQLHPVEVREPYPFDQAFATMVEAHVDALITHSSAVFFTRRTQIVDLAARMRLPGIFPEREFAEAGGLMAYGMDVLTHFRRAATYVDKILKGAKPADLPVERPMKFELVINLKTAQALGLTIPPTLLFQADEVIR